MNACLAEVVDSGFDSSGEEAGNTADTYCFHISGGIELYLFYEVIAGKRTNQSLRG
jgi:hypothetical protein